MKIDHCCIGWNSYMWFIPFWWKEYFDVSVSRSFSFSLEVHSPINPQACFNRFRSIMFYEFWCYLRMTLLVCHFLILLGVFRYFLYKTLYMLGRTYQFFPSDVNHLLYFKVVIANIKTVSLRLIASSFFTRSLVIFRHHPFPYLVYSTKFIGCFQYYCCCFHSISH